MMTTPTKLTSHTHAAMEQLYKQNVDPSELKVATNHVIDAYVKFVQRKQQSQEAKEDGLHMIAQAAAALEDKVYIEAYYPPKDMKLLVNVKKATHVVYSSGTVRETYTMPNGMVVKLYHHSCNFVGLKDKCDNCRLQKRRGRCYKGSLKYILMTSNK